MDFSHYLEPVVDECLDCRKKEVADKLGSHVDVYTEEKGFPDWEKADMVIVGICEGRGSDGNEGCAKGADQIRKYLYRLARPSEKVRLADVGNIMPADSLEDTHYAITDVLYRLLEANKTIIVIGGGQDTTFAVYKAYEVLGQIVNICGVDSRFDLENSPDEVTASSYLSHIIMQDPNYLFNFSNIGYQTYFVGTPYVKLMDDLKFDAYRLGAVQHDMLRAEPLIRNADIISIDMGSVRQSDAPANADPSPHGFYGEQLCQLSRFAGMSDKTSCIGFHEMNPDFDIHGQTAHLTAHAVWFFIEGFYSRLSDFPYRDKQNYKRFIVDLKEQGLELVFYKSMKSDRWWVELPCNDEDRKVRYSRHLLIPCNYSDYEQAMQNEIPDLWWKFFVRLND